MVNVPSLSAGVVCVFDGLSESQGEVLSKGQVLCMSPSLRDLPALTQGFGKENSNKLLIYLLHCIDFIEGRTEIRNYRP